jgi:hypothetical protein
MSRIVKNATAVLFGLAALTIAAEKAAAYDPALNAKVVSFARSKLGQQVGDGQCWALADQALAAAGAHRPGRDGYAAYVFGQSYHPTPYWTYHGHRLPAYIAVQPGDVIQFEGVKFVYPNGSWYEFPHHTAIVLGRSGNKIEVIHQNVNGVMQVSTMTLDMAAKKQGTMTFFHPVPR